MYIDVLSGSRALKVVVGGDCGDVSTAAAAVRCSCLEPSV